MRKKSVNIRTERLIILYSAEEFDQLKKNYARSTTRTISGYVRKISLNEPVEMINRNGSFDSFVEEIIVLRKELAAVRDQGLFTPERQERIIQLQEEIRTFINKIADLCMPR